MPPSHHPTGGNVKTKPCNQCSGEAELVRYCGAYVCDDCGSHVGLVRCYCGWSADGGDGYAQLIEDGEVIEPEH